ncbi:trichohyalin-like isoform X2 [Dreissena polymorpha]|uniref:Uncharacterized protein n=1 Tax=Dreissena polymorpha TaxID=45954 RepID=A0A9D3YWJ9_DREPO|nr:trichohyalin-like isoform X2 [Dreissena polymorpha]KAH3705448.1 hypothetical protein DPMN_080520 [Dreissena polymorpha]
MAAFNYKDLCLQTSWVEKITDFTIDKGWVAGAFFLGLFIGGLITFFIVPPCIRDWEKKKNADLFKRQDEEELIANEEAATKADLKKEEVKEAKADGKPSDGKPSKLSAAAAFFQRKKKSGKDTGTTPAKSWVEPEGDSKNVSTSTASVGMVTVLTMTNSGQADTEMVKQDLSDIQKMDTDQKKVKDDMKMKMLKMSLRKMKGKGQIGDPYLADFAQKIIDQRHGNEEMITLETKEQEQELNLKHKKNPAHLQQELDLLNIRMNAKRNQLDKDEDGWIRSELIRTSGLSESEVDELLEKLKADMAELERRQGLEQLRQARHLAERLEKRRQLLEFHRLQEQQGAQETIDDVQAFEEPLSKLVEEGKLIDRQKQEILEEHDQNLKNLLKSQQLDAMRLQRDLAEKLKQRREARMRKLDEKQEKEQAVFLSKAEKSTSTTEFVNGYQNLLEQQQLEVEAAETEVDQTELEELEKLAQDLDAKRANQIKELADKMVQSVTRIGQLGEGDAKRIIKLHNMRMDALNNRRKEEQQLMRARLQERWQQRLKKIELDEVASQNEREAIIEQQDNTVKRVLNSNLDLTEDAKEKILKEHERNMVALNNQLSRSKLRQKMSLEQKLSQRRARLVEIQAKQEALKAEKKGLSDKEMQKLQEQLDQEVLLFEKERKEAENNLRKQLAAETEAALSQQEKGLAALIGRLEVGQARRMAVLQKQDQTLKDLQENLQNSIDSGRLSANKADQIIQQHYNQVEHVNERLQRNREQQEAVIQEKIQAKRFMKERELQDQLRREKEELMMTRKKAGTGMASQILNAALMEQRHKKAMEDLEKEMQVELERCRDELNNQLQSSLEKELESHKGQFLNELAAATKTSAQELRQANTPSAMGRPGSATRLGQLEKSRSTLGTMEEDSDDDNYPKPSYPRPKSSVGSKAESRLANLDTSKQKKKNTFGPQPPRQAFGTSTGEQVHGMWDFDDEML